MTLEAAREAARRELGEVAEHGAPLAVIEAQKPVHERALTLGDFIGAHFKPWALANQASGDSTMAGLNSIWSGLYEIDLREVTAYHVEQIKSARLTAGMAPATVNRDLDRIRRVFSCAVEWHFIDTHPMAGKKVRRIKGSNERVRYLGQHDRNEERRLRKALADREAERRRQRASGNEWLEQRGKNPRAEWPADGFTDHLMPMVIIALNTGLRRGELFGLEWSSVNLAQKVLTVQVGTAKSRKARHIPLNAEALDTLKRWKKKGASAGLVFPSPSDGRFDNINKAWDGIVADAKLQDFHFHDLRHDFASKLVMAGVDLNTVRELMGHADIKMTLRYAHLSPGKLADAVSRIIRS